MSQIELIIQEWGIFAAVLAWAFSYGILNNKVANLKTELRELKEKDFAKMEARIESIEKICNNVTNGMINVIDKLTYISENLDRNHEEDKEYRAEIKKNVKTIFDKFNEYDKNIQRFYRVNPNIIEPER